MERETTSLKATEEPMLMRLSRMAIVAVSAIEARGSVVRGSI